MPQENLVIKGYRCLDAKVSLEGRPKVCTPLFEGKIVGIEVREKKSYGEEEEDM